MVKMGFISGLQNLGYFHHIMLIPCTILLRDRKKLEEASRDHAALYLTGAQKFQSFYFRHIQSRGH
jgi:hypothetical protein